MSYEFFEPRFVYFMWDDKLEGKKVFLADWIRDIIDDVEDESSRTTLVQCDNVDEDSNTPFRSVRDDGSLGASWQFAYYDPHYEFKVAHSKGKQIQALEDGEWRDCHSPTWSILYEYRIKPDEPEPEPEPEAVSNIVLAKWLAEGKGQVRRLNNGLVRTHWIYPEGEDFCAVPVDGSIVVRKWTDDWVTPTREYIEQDQ